MPFPSGRCKTCRSRRIKCDETRPECTQCSKSARVCSWDETDSVGVMFRDENDYASNRAKRRRGGARAAIESLTQEMASATSTEHSVRSSPILIKSDQQHSAMPTLIPMILIHPSESIESHALNKLVRSFIDAEEQLDSDIWGFLREYRSDFFPLQPHSTFVPAVMAFALVHFGRTSHDATAIAASRRYYSQALVSTSKALQSESMAVADEIALSVVMLAGYEDQQGNFDRTKLRTQGFSHLEGVKALLRAREQHGKFSARSQSLDRFIRRRIIRASIHHAVAMDLPAQDGDFHSRQPVCDALYRCLVGIAALRSDVRSVLRTILSTPPTERNVQLPKLYHAIKATQDMDARLENWRLNLPYEWQYEVHTVSDSHYDYCQPTEIFYSSTYHEYSNQEIYLMWNNYRAARLVTLGLLVKIAGIDSNINRVLAERYAFDLGSTIDTMRTLVEDIAATIPGHFDSIFNPPRTRDELIQRTPVSTAFHLVLPLVIASATLPIPEELRNWFKSVLQLVSQISGNAVLAMLAGMDLHTHLVLQPQLKSYSSSQN